MYGKMFFDKYKLRILALEKQNLELEQKLKNLTSQLPRLFELSQFLTDLEKSAGSLLHVKRIRPDEVYLWRHDE